MHIVNVNTPTENRPTKPTCHSIDCILVFYSNGLYFLGMRLPLVQTLQRTLQGGFSTNQGKISLSKNIISYRKKIPQTTFP